MTFPGLFHEMVDDGVHIAIRFLALILLLVLVWFDNVPVIRLAIVAFLGLLLLANAFTLLSFFLVSPCQMLSLTVLHRHLSTQSLPASPWCS